MGITHLLQGGHLALSGVQSLGVPHSHVVRPWESEGPRAAQAGTEKARPGTLCWPHRHRDPPGQGAAPLSTQLPTLSPQGAPVEASQAHKRPSAPWTFCPMFSASAKGLCLSLVGPGHLPSLALPKVQWDGRGWHSSSPWQATRPSPSILAWPPKACILLVVGTQGS